MERREVGQKNMLSNFLELVLQVVRKFLHDDLLADNDGNIDKQR
jgi:hypothetical protein